MIDLSTLIEKLQKKLNDELKNDNSGVLDNCQFKIFEDTGALQLDTREENTVTEYINGEMRTVSSEISSLNNGSVVATQNCKVDFIVRLEDIEYDEEEYALALDGEGKLSKELLDVIYGNATKIKAIRALFDKVFSINGTERLVINDKSYVVTTIYTLANSGIREQAPMLGDSYSFTVYIFYIFIENGINTTDLIVTLDGQNLPFEGITIMRTPTLDGIVPANTAKGALENVATMSQLMVSLELPALESEVNEKIRDFIFDGTLNKKYSLGLGFNTANMHYYDVTMSVGRLNGETVKNMGLQVSFVEIIDDEEIVV